MITPIFPTSTPRNRIWKEATKSSPIFLPQGITKIVLDFDNTVGYTEYLHRTSFKETTWKFIEEDTQRKMVKQSPGDIAGRLKEVRDLFDGANGAWSKSGFVKAFGKPERTSCDIVAQCLHSNFGLMIDPNQIRLRRFETIAEATAALLDMKAALMHKSEAPSLYRIETVMQAIENARPIKGLMELLTTAQSRGIEIGLCTGSSSEFVEPILKSFGLDRMVPDDNRIFANDYDPEKGKPDPHPFLITFDKMKLKAARPNHYPQVLILEDSISGATAAMAAGAHVAFAPGKSYGPDLGYIHDIAQRTSFPVGSNGKEAYLHSAIEHNRNCGNEFLLMSKNHGWSQLRFNPL